MSRLEPQHLLTSIASVVSYLESGHHSKKCKIEVLGVLTLAAWNFYLTAVGFFALWFPGFQWAFVASMTYQATIRFGG